jgi:RNA polymerase sigma-70 factor (ECF subfamily)
MTSDRAGRPPGPRRAACAAMHSKSGTMAAKPDFPCPEPLFGCRLCCMGMARADNSSETERLLERAAAGDREALGALLAQHWERLRRLVALRLDPRLQGRIDPADVVQEACLEASARLAEYLRQPALPFFLWLRLITGQKVLTMHRRHLGAEMRAVGREVALYQGSMPETSSAALAAQLLGHDTRPSEAAMRAERKIRLQEALNGMDPLDREVLALRHFEQLSNVETAQVLGIKEGAAGKRYLRALERLREILLQMPGGVGEFLP